MAKKNATIKINADSSNAEQGINKVIKSVNKLKKSAPLDKTAKVGASISGLASGLSLLTKSVKAVTGAMKDCNSAYMKQATAERQLEIAANNNPYLDDSSVAALKNYASELQKISVVGDEELLPFMAQLASAGRSQSEIMDIMSAALDVSASGAMSLESAVKSLNQTYSGTTGQLGKTIPQIKALTAEELKSGKAVKVVADAYKGMAEETAKTSGSAQQLANAWGDVKERVGKAVNASFAPLQKAITNVAVSTLEVVDGFQTMQEKAVTAAETAAAAFGIGTASMKNQIQEMKKQLDELNDKASKEFYESYEDAVQRQLTATEFAKKTAEDALVKLYKIDPMPERMENESLDKFEKRVKEWEKSFKKTQREWERIAQDFISFEGQTEEEITERLSAWIAVNGDAFSLTVEGLRNILIYEGNLTAQTGGLQDTVENLNKEMQEGIELAKKKAQEDADAAKAAAEAEEARRKAEEENNKRQSTEEKAKQKYREAIESEKQEIEIRRKAGQEIDELTEKQLIYNATVTQLQKLIQDDNYVSAENQFVIDELDKAKRLYAEIGAEKDKLKENPLEEKEISEDLQQALDLLEKYAKAADVREEDNMAAREKIKLLEEQRKAIEENYETLKIYADKEVDLEKKKAKAIEEINKEIADIRKNSGEKALESFIGIFDSVTDYVNQTIQIIQQATDLMLKQVQANTEEELARTEELYNSGKISAEEYEQAKLEIQRDAAKKEYEIQLTQWGLSLAQATADIAAGIAKCFTQGFPMGVISGAILSAAGAVQIASIMAAKPKPPAFATGGIVPGTSYTGDNVLIRANSGEGIFTREQMKAMGLSMNGNSGGVNVFVNNSASNIVNAEPRVTQKGLEVYIDARVNEGLKKGRYRSGLSYAKNSEAGSLYSL